MLERGLLELSAQNPREARIDLEQALAMLEGADVDRAAEAKFALARALWAAPRERTRATALARAARAGGGEGASGKRRIAEIDVWLAERS